MSKVLIIEDDLMTADMVEEALVGQGYEVCGIARTVAQALELQHRHRPDLALVDQRLADNGLGTDFVAQIAGSDKIGVLYASGNVAHVIQNATAGHGCLAKPYKPHQLLQSMKIVSDLVAGRPALPPFPNGFQILAFPSADGLSKAADRAEAQLLKLRRQQAALAGFGSFALHEPDLMAILTEAARLCADGLNAPFCKICRYRENENDLLIEAGFGWDKGVVGEVVSRADESSPQGRAFVTGMPSVCTDLSADRSYSLPTFYRTHGIVSSVDVVIKGDAKPYGILEIDDSDQHNYDQHDIDFLTGFANILAATVANNARVRALGRHITQMKVIMDEKKVLAEELQHRVRNNLQLVQGMLSKLSTDAEGQPAQRGVDAVSRRVATLAEVYNHLRGTEMARTTDFGDYLRSLCASLVQVHASSDKDIKLICECDSFVLGLDTVTSLGIIAAELIANCFEHAFSSGPGVVNVQVRRVSSTQGKMTVGDNGVGFTEIAGSKRQGLGLVRRLVEQLDGSVTCAANQGTLWSIQFPANEHAGI